MGGILCSLDPGPEHGPKVSARIDFGGVFFSVEVLAAKSGQSSRKILIGIEELTGCQFERGLRYDRLRIRLKSPCTLGGVPGAEYDGVTVRLARRDRAEAERLVQRIAALFCARPDAFSRRAVPRPSLSKPVMAVSATGVRDVVGQASSPW